MSHSLYVNRIDEQVIPGRRLGRHVAHDSRSLGYRVRPAGVVVARLHTRNAPILDQGDLGSCTGNAECGALATSPVFEALPAGHPPLDEAEAVRLYSEATRLDPFPGSYPPDDTGSDGLSACKAAKNEGLISGYLNAADVTGMAVALQDGPVIIGVNWYSSFDTPAGDGLITISPSARVRGGHELVVRGVDPERRQFLGDNSWGTSWGDRGSFLIGFDDMARLLGEDGDCYAPLPLTVPVPPPVPPPPPPDVHVDSADAALWSPDVQRWVRARHSGTNRKTAQDLIAWAKAKHLTA